MSAGRPRRGLEVMQRAEHPADRVAQLAVGLDGVLEDFRADALVVGIVGGAHPQPQDVGAGLRHDLLRLDGVADRLRHLAAVLVQREAVGQHDVERRAAAGAAAFQQRRLEPAAMLVGPSRYITVSSPPSTLRLMPARPGKWTGSSSTKHGSSRNQPDVADIVDLLPFLVGERAEEALAGAVHVPGVGAFLLEGVRDALVDGVVLQDFGRAVALLAHEHRDRHAPGALARDHPVGPAGIMPLMRFSPTAAPIRHRDRLQRAGAQGIAGPDLAVDRAISLVHRDEPLRRVAEDHGFFERQECGYWCLSRPRASSVPARPAP